MSYLESKTGSIQEVVKEMQKHLKDNAYQDLFKKELEKTGKGIGSMSDMEKKDFFNKLDKMYKGKKEAKVDELTSGQKKLPPALQKAIKDKEDKAEEESVDVEKLKEDVDTLLSAHSLWSNAGDTMEEMKKNSKYMKAQDVAPDNDSDAESEKEKSGKTLIGSKKTKIVTEPKVDYQK